MFYILYIIVFSVFTLKIWSLYSHWGSGLPSGALHSGLLVLLRGWRRWRFPPRPPRRQCWSPDRSSRAAHRFCEAPGSSCLLPSCHGGWVSIVVAMEEGGLVGNHTYSRAPCRLQRQQNNNHCVTPTWCITEVWLVLVQLFVPHYV